jgi:hypothetical protein
MANDANLLEVMNILGYVDGTHTATIRFKIIGQDLLDAAADDLAAMEDVFQGIDFGGSAYDAIGAAGGRAMGGPVWADQPYIVGERGAELFVPNSNGTIVPNNQVNVAAPQVIVILDGEEIAARVISRVGGAARSARSAGAWVTGE